MTGSLPISLDHDLPRDQSEDALSSPRNDEVEEDKKGKGTDSRTVGGGTPWKGLEESTRFYQVS